MEGCARSQVATSTQEEEITRVEDSLTLMELTTARPLSSRPGERNDPIAFIIHNQSEYCHL